MHKLIVLDKSGDTTVVWENDVTTKDGRAAIKEAERIFAEQVRAGRAVVDTETGERLETFDPTRTSMCSIPRLVGG